MWRDGRPDPDLRGDACCLLPSSAACTTRLPDPSPPLRVAAAAAESRRGQAPAAAPWPWLPRLSPAHRRRCRPGRLPPGPATAHAAPSRSRPSTHRSGPPSAGLRRAAAGSGCAARRRLGSAARAHRCRHRGAAPARSPAQTPRCAGWRGSGAALRRAGGRQGRGWETRGRGHHVEGCALAERRRSCRRGAGASRGHRRAVIMAPSGFHDPHLALGRPGESS